MFFVVSVGAVELDEFVSGAAALATAVGSLCCAHAPIATSSNNISPVFFMLPPSQRADSIFPGLG
jgi:hypothetical protein